MRKYVLLSIVALFIFASCSGDLSRSQAENILKNKGQKVVITRYITSDLLIHNWVQTIQMVPIDHVNPLIGQYLEAVYGSTEKDENVEQRIFLEKLRDAGYIQLSRYKKVQYTTAPSMTPPEHRETVRDDYYHIEITPQLNPFIRSSNFGTLELIVAEVVCDEIEGITKAPMDESGRIVVYRTRATENELAKFFPLKPNESSPKKYNAYFKKYDDGWRLEGG